jgi:hypothetical protein
VFDTNLPLFKSLLCNEQDGEIVEFTTQMDPRGRVKADRVTGPMGAHVQGVARRSFREFDDSINSFSKRQRQFDDNSFDDYELENHNK